MYENQQAKGTEMGSRLRSARVALRDRYSRDPEAAIAVTGAVSVPSDPDDPLHNDVRITGYPDVVLQTGLHPALGGMGDQPCPGDILSAALVSCMESTILSAADLMDIKLRSVHVEVVNAADLRPVFRVNDDEPLKGVGLSLTALVEPEPGTDPERVARLLEVAERGSAMLQMLRGGAEVDTRMESNA
jgi:uncharacterized OsmC-like protein